MKLNLFNTIITLLSFLIALYTIWEARQLKVHNTELIETRLSALLDIMKNNHELTRDNQFEIRQIQLQIYKIADQSTQQHTEPTESPIFWTFPLQVQTPLLIRQSWQNEKPQPSTPTYDDLFTAFQSHDDFFEQPPPIMPFLYQLFETIEPHFVISIGIKSAIPIASALRDMSLDSPCLLCIGNLPLFRTSDWKMHISIMNCFNLT